jgi:hypothetical protein
MDDGASFKLQVGDEVVPRLPLPDAGQAGWVVSAAPDTGILAGGDTFRFIPSDPDEGEGYQEFSFIAAGVGTTTVTITRGVAESLTFTVEVAG